MATLILFGAINIALDGNEPYRIEVAENLEVCLALVRRATSPSVVVIGSAVAESERNAVVEAARTGRAYFLVTNAGDSSARIKRLVRGVLKTGGDKESGAR